MTTLAIRATGLGKRYRIGSATERHDSIRDALAAAVRAPLRNLRQVRKLGAFDDTESDDIVWALRDVSFDVRHGEVVGVIGRNGAGKSTLLKLLSRITEPSTGRALIHGRVGSLLEVGTGFHPDLTGRENVYLNGAILGMDRAYVDRRFEEIIDFAGVARYIDTPVKRYSSGMYLRLAFAVAAHLEPEILIVDEVLAVGDAQFQKKCLGKMSDVSREGRTVLFVSHNLTAVRTLCTRAVLLRSGELVADEPAAEAVAKYVAELQDCVLEREYSEYNAPQNLSAAIRRMSIRDLNGDPVGEVTTSTPFAVEFEYDTKHDGVYVGLTAIVNDMENNTAFISINNRERAWYGRAMPQGRYRTRCIIPGNLLNAGWYSIGFNIFGSSFSDNYHQSEALRVEIQDSADVRGDYFGPYWGLMRPALDWVTEPIVGHA